MTPGARGLNTYRAVSIASGRWAVEWFLGDASMGLVVGTFDYEPEALFAVYTLARMEARSIRVAGHRLPPPHDDA